MLLALGHWCCLAASHHVPSPLLSCSTAVARPLPPIPGAVTQGAAVSATTVISQLAHSPLPHLTSLLASTGLPAGSTISRYHDTDWIWIFCHDIIPTRDVPFSPNSITPTYPIGEVGIMEFGINGTSRVCCGEVGIVEFGLYGQRLDVNKRMN